MMPVRCGGRCERATRLHEGWNFRSALGLFCDGALQSAVVESASASFADRTGARFQAVWPLRPSGIQGQRPKRTALPLSRQRHTCCEHCPPLRIDCHQHGAVDSDIQQIFFSGIRRSCRPLKHIPPRAIHKRGGCPIRSKQQLHFPFPRQNQRKPWMFSR